MPRRRQVVGGGCRGGEPRSLWLIRSQGDVPADDGWLAPAEAARLAGYTRDKRRREYRLRRWAGKQAVAAFAGLGREPSTMAAIEVLNRPDGSPYAVVDGVPLEVGISLTDRLDRAVCLVGGREGVEVGVDLEIVEPRSDGFVTDFLTPAEREIVHGGGAAWGLDRDAAANLIWSAKESALKVLRTGLRADTWTVEVCLTGPVGPGGWAPLHVRSAGSGRRLPGWWRRWEGFLLTVAHDVEAAPPTAAL
jgi:4'-phosphopantetheinyl transferase